MELKLGKQPTKSDSRTLQLKATLRTIPPVPDISDVDKNLDVDIPNPMFANNAWGDCVIAGRAHMTRRFEQYEQKLTLSISDKEVLREYWKEGGASCRNKRPDNGLIMLDSLKRWRKNGWRISKEHYDIYAFSQIHPTDHDEVKVAVHLLSGAYAGILLPLSAQSQFENKEIWEVTKDKGVWGGHCCFVVAYDTTGPTCVTWGQRQSMTWKFWNKYADECYAVLDSPNKWLGDYSPVDIEKLSRYLKEIAT